MIISEIVCMCVRERVYERGEPIYSMRRSFYLAALFHEQRTHIIVTTKKYRVPQGESLAGEATGGKKKKGRERRGRGVCPTAAEKKTMCGQRAVPEINVSPPITGD